MTKPIATGNGPVSRRTLVKRSLAGAGALAGGFPAILSRASAAEGVVHFGASLPFTGPYEKVSRVFKDGYDFWTKTTGGKIDVGGKKLDIKWTIYDDENNASRTAQLTEKLISDDKVDLIAGAYGTDTVLAQGAIAAKHKRVTIQSGAASARVDEELGGHTTFTLIGTAKTYHMLAMDYLATKSPKPQTVGIVIMDDPVYQEFAVGIRERCAAHGMKVVFEEVLPMNVQDLRPTVLKMKRAGNLDIVVNTGWDLICTKLVEEMSTLGVVPKAFDGGHLTTTPTVKQTLGTKLKDVIGVTFWLPQFKYRDPYFKSPAEFAERFQKAYGYPPTYHAAMSYSIPLLYETVLKDADPADPFNQATIRNKLAKIETETVWGPISFDARGRIKRPGVPVIQWIGEEPAIKIVYPAEMAESPGVYPRGPWS